jgi:hypothetical protein
MPSRQELGEEAFNALFAEGRRLPPDVVVARPGRCRRGAGQPADLAR